MAADGLDLTPASGTYILLLRLRRRQVLSVGKLGEISFSPGWYAYAGSAFGPGGLAARIGRHLRKGKKHHWHIDYLRDAARMAGVWTASGPRRLEHQWARALMEAPLDGRAVIGFGCSDCRCRSHLLYYKTRLHPAHVRQALGAQWHPAAG